MTEKRHGVISSATAPLSGGSWFEFNSGERFSLQKCLVVPLILPLGKCWHGTLK